MTENECLELIGIHSAFLQDIWHLFLDPKSWDSLANGFDYMWSKILPVCAAAKVKYKLSA